MPATTTTFKAIKIEPEPNVPGFKREYSIWSRLSGSRLGRIRWHGEWCQYVLCPDRSTAWPEGRLWDVAEFMRDLEAEHRNALVDCADQGGRKP